MKAKDIYKFSEQDIISEIQTPMVDQTPPRRKLTPEEEKAMWDKFYSGTDIDTAIKNGF
jgi:hypothetical protein